MLNHVSLAFHSIITQPKPWFGKNAFLYLTNGEKNGKIQDLLRCQDYSLKSKTKTWLFF